MNFDDLLKKSLKFFDRTTVFNSSVFSSQILDEIHLTFVGGKSCA